MQDRLKKVTVNLPADVLENATRLTGKGITPTILEGLLELERRAKRSALRALKGKVRVELDLEERAAMRFPSRLGSGRRRATSATRSRGAA